MSSWRPLVAGTLCLFLVILAFLAGQLRAGGDPALRRSAAQQTAPPAAQAPQQDFGDGSQAPDGNAPGGAQPDLSPPTSHQS
jgi:hypothetical protein